MRWCHSKGLGADGLIWSCDCILQHGDSVALTYAYILPKEPLHAGFCLQKRPIMQSLFAQELCMELTCSAIRLQSAERSLQGRVISAEDPSNVGSSRTRDLYGVDSVVTA